MDLPCGEKALRILQEVIYLQLNKLYITFVYLKFGCADANIADSSQRYAKLFNRKPSQGIQDMSEKIIFTYSLYFNIHAIICHQKHFPDLFLLDRAWRRRDRVLQLLFEHSSIVECKHF